MREGTGTRVAVPDDWVPCFQVRGLWDESGALAVTEPARRQTTSSVAQFLRSRMLGEAALISGSTAKVWIPSTDRCATPPPREKKRLSMLDGENFAAECNRAMDTCWRSVGKPLTTAWQVPGPSWATEMVVCLLVLQMMACPEFSSASWG